MVGNKIKFDDRVQDKIFRDYYNYRKYKSHNDCRSCSPSQRIRRLKELGVKDIG